MTESEQRGIELLMSYNLEHSQVHRLAFSIDRFKNAAAAKSWCKNHGFAILETPRQQKNVVVIKVNSEDKFEDSTLCTANISKGVNATIGTLKKVVIDDLDSDNPSVDEIKTQKSKPKIATTVVEFAKRGELFIRKSEEDDPEVSVRMFGIVMKPEIPDCVGDITSHQEVENANFVFMKEFETMGFMHKKDVSDRVQIIQNVIAPVDFEFPLPDGGVKKISQGTWYQELYTDDPELVKRVRGGTLNGLSIGGKAQREEITEMLEGVTKLLPNLNLGAKHNIQISKFIAERNLNKAEGDEALGRFHNLRVQEVSLVDAAANEEDFFIVKRRDDMSTKKQDEIDSKAKAKAEAEAKAKAEVKTKAEATTGDADLQAGGDVEPTLAEQVAAGVEAGVKAALEASNKAANKAAPAKADPVKADDDPVTKGFKEIGTRFDALEKGLKETNEKVDSVAVVKAVAKGTSVPDDTTKPAGKDDEDESMWAGTVVHQKYGGR